MEFNSTSAKLARYNGIIVALSNLLLWWDSLSLVDKASPVNIDTLVQRGEETLNAERAAWLSAGAPKDDKEKAQENEASEEKSKKQ